MKTLMLAAAALLAPALAGAVVPINGGAAGFSDQAVNTGPGDQTDPHVSGDLAAYTDFSVTAGEIRYYDFLTGADLPIPTGANGEIDTLSDVSGTNIAFSRQMADRNACMIFDVTTFTETEIAPQIGPRRFATAIGSNTVAFVDSSVGNNDIFAANITTPLAAPLNLSASPNDDSNPSVSPAGTAVVWESCSASDCGIMKALFDGLTWAAPQVVSNTASVELNADTDGANIVYQSARPAATGQDIYYQPLAGGAEVQIELAGVQRSPTISQGVIAFESAETASLPADLYIYVIDKNAVFQITNTSGINESLNDVTILSTGEVRVVWTADDELGGRGNIYADTFLVPDVLTIDNVSQAEGDSFAPAPTFLTFTVTLHSASASTVTVAYTTVDGKATAADGDYEPVSGTLTFSPGETSKTITVRVYGDSKVEDDETFSVKLSNPLNAVVSPTQGVGTGTIENDDTAEVTPTEAVQNLIEKLSNLGLTRQINSLTGKLNDVLASIEAGLYDQAINQLKAFINEVEAAKNKKMTAAAADTLIADANAIIAMLSGA